jgi:hypothetical protein
MNWELIFVAVLIAILFFAKTFFWRKLEDNKSEEEQFVWQPDLSHKVVVSEFEASRAMGGTQQHIILVEKTPEERDEERRQYLKENRNDRHTHPD